MLGELQAPGAGPASATDWCEWLVQKLIEHILIRFHHRFVASKIRGLGHCGGANPALPFSKTAYMRVLQANRG